MPTVQELLAQQALAAQQARERYTQGGWPALFQGAQSESAPADFLSTYGGTMYSPLGAATNYTTQQRQALAAAGIPLSLGETGRFYYNGRIYRDVPGNPGGAGLVYLMSPEDQTAMQNRIVGLGAGTENENAWAAGLPTPPLRGIPQPDPVIGGGGGGTPAPSGSGGGLTPFPTTGGGGSAPSGARYGLWNQPALSPLLHRFAQMDQGAVNPLGSNWSRRPYQWQQQQPDTGALSTAVSRIMAQKSYGG